MSEFRLTTDGMRYIALFEALTGAVAMDCVVDDENERLIFVIKSGHMGMAIGKKGSNINRVKDSIKRSVEIVEYSDDASEFVGNLFLPTKIKNVEMVDKKGKLFAYVDVQAKDKGIAIGKNGRNIQKAKILAQRHHSINDVYIR
ncbi:MAG: NusA-like transcription termination signal-binding factor [Halobacteriota archaeon]|nr:NusA-like transcription termination signal-binding factor [Halobacteriota archaeon]